MPRGGTLSNWSLATPVPTSALEPSLVTSVRHKSLVYRLHRKSQNFPGVNKVSKNLGSHLTDHSMRAQPP